MTAKEIRMRCIEAVADMGVRSADRIIRDAKALEEWVAAAPDKESSPAKPTPKKIAAKS